MRLSGKKIILGVTGGIAAYKATYLTRLFVKEGANVTIVMTQAAEKFITPLTLQALSGHAVIRDLYNGETGNGIVHISTASQADLVVIAPATANTIAKIRAGMADNLLTSVVLATNAPILLAPAMNKIMWENPATQENIETLKKRGFSLCGPTSGFQACGTNGVGRMSEPEEILEKAIEVINSNGNTDKSSSQCNLSGTKIVITAGPTVEPIDPVRYISNYSSGKMGYAIASAAQKLGADVTLISGPTQLTPPKDINVLKVNTALEMQKAVTDNLADTDIFIATAAVADYRPEAIAPQKIKKEATGNAASISIKLIQNPDILYETGHSNQRPTIVAGFAAETQDLEKFATSKLEKKNADVVFGNDVSKKDIGFNSDNNELYVFRRDKLPTDKLQGSKEELGFKIMEILKGMLDNKQKN